MNDKQMFDGRECVVATMHQKEKVIAPLLKEELGLQVITPQNFNSDAFGTFSGEVSRKGDQLEAAKRKLKEAMDMTGVSIGVASEGSFGNDTLFRGAAVNRELILLIDKKEELEVVGYVKNNHTNYAQSEVENYEEAYAFAKSIGFPEHAVIVKAHRKAKKKADMVKGITSAEQLKKAVTTLLQKKNTSFSFLKKRQKSLWIETDMRAMYNPTRMKNIELATRDLITKLQSTCPSCQAPGYEITEVKDGLPCAGCGIETASTLSHTYTCQKCHYTEEKLYPNGVTRTDPTYCSICNP
ncbi:DUF6671 family protein [Evansella cellulosilytica]|uniref:DUF6671 domain-containing protein n=1 Tax=Evansella cellulosilytica (strain ATCC 21833 / DSM 2522 / FERM P-1141 / JCM 9156 / N-4) TaxID=649639 RepID=E6TT17_EVAC2|nr:DUF6671 family protein [Evansella cellulosilytica]ADU31925.1 hypothetical protein Bcell_3684 [Evansella cellulosilytica DSM 2522]